MCRVCLGGSNFDVSSPGASVLGVAGGGGGRLWSVIPYGNYCACCWDQSSGMEARCTHMIS